MELKLQKRMVLTVFLLSLFIVTNVFGQIGVSNISELPRLKNGITYIVVKDPNSDKDKEYFNVFKKNWTFSKIEVIKYSEIESHLSPENSFLTLSGYSYTSQFSRLGSDGMEHRGVSYNITHIYLEFWTCTEEYFKKQKKELSSSDKIQIGRIELYTDYKTLAQPDMFFKPDYDENEHIRNWGSGILKNNIKTLMSYLNANSEHWLYSDALNYHELKKLKDAVLYVPDYVLIESNKFSGDESKRHKEEDVFGSYKLKYKLLSTKDLNEKILNDKEGFYYLTYIKSCTDKYVNVVNSLTGEIVYSKYVPASYNIKSKDLKTLYKKIID